MKDSIVKLAFLFILVSISAFVSAQQRKGEFFGYMSAAANFCQIDGDGASGYTKFGFSAGYTVGQGLKEVKNGSWAYLSGVAFSVRGSRRAFNPDNPGDQSFHYVYQMIDVPVFISRYISMFSVGGGLRTTYLLSAKDLDNFTPDLQSNMRQVNMIACAFFDYQSNEKLRYVVEFQYSANSIRTGSSRAGFLFPTGIFHNVISAGIRYNPAGGKK